MVMVRVILMITALISINGVSYASDITLSCEYRNGGKTETTSIVINEELGTIDGKSEVVTFTSTKIRWNRVGMVNWKLDCRDCEGYIDRVSGEYKEWHNRMNTKKWGVARGRCERSRQAF